MNGYLATITSDAENQFVFQLINNQDTFWVRDSCGGSNNGPWIGGSDIATEGQWEWITGEAFTYENWKPGQPDNAGGGENCLHFWTYFGNPPEPFWNDAPCDGFTAYPEVCGTGPVFGPLGYIVEYDSAPEEPVNDLVAFEPISSTYQFTTATTGCPAGFDGIFSFAAQLTNISDRTLAHLQVAVAELTDGNVLLTEDGLLGKDERFSVPQGDDFTDARLSSGELVDVPFAVCLQERRQFRLLVDVLGTVLPPVPVGISEKSEPDPH
jgi:hypothetical protein